MPATLCFYDLEEDYLLKYIELTNEIAHLQLRLRRSVPIRGVMAIVTMGTSLLISGPRTLWHVTKISMARDRAKAFVENERDRRKCANIEWNTFPSAHIVLGGEPMEADGPLIMCPLCKRTEMRSFVGSSTHEILSCNHCDRTIAVSVDRRALRTEEILIPGILIAPIPFTHPIEHLGELGQHLIDCADMLGTAVDALIDMIL